MSRLTASPPRTSLTDRYVSAVTRRLPHDQRADVETELRATIADMVDARLAPLGGSSGSAARHDEAEAKVLTELGDPDRLAAEYRGRPNYLIGPELFPDYRRLLVLLLSIVPAAAGGGVVIASLLAGDGAVAALASGVGVAFTAALHVAFWTTLGFAVVERAGDGKRLPRRAGWDPSSLPDVPRPGRVTATDAVASIAFAALAIGFLFWQRTASWLSGPDGAPIPVLNPDRWDFWIPFLVVVLAAGIVLDLVRLRRGHWTWPLAAANAALGLLLAAPFLGVLGAEPMVNPAFLAELAAVTGSQAAADVFARTVSVVVVVAVVIDASSGVVQARRYATAAPAAARPRR